MIKKKELFYENFCIEFHRKSSIKMKNDTPQKLYFSHYDNTEVGSITIIYSSLFIPMNNNKDPWI